MSAEYNCPPLCSVCHKLHYVNVRCDDAWMDNPENRATYEQGLAKLDEELKPWADALRDSSKLSAEDYGIVFNATDE